MKVTKKLLLISLFPIFCLILSEIFSFYSLKKSNDQAKDFLVGFTERQTKMAKIHSLLGYGRGIHAFKNYLLRGNSEYKETAESTLKEALEEIDSYQALRPLSLVEKSTLDTLESTTNEYLSKISIISSLKKEGRKIQEIDEVVRIDDTSTILALNKLNDFFIQLEQSEKNRIDENFKSQLKIIFIWYFLIIIVSYLMTSKISLQLSTSLTKLIQQSKRISILNFSKDSTQERPEYNDEINELESKMKTMEKAIQTTFDKLENSNRELENFAYVATHDIKSPLKKIASFSDIINHDSKNHNYGEIELYSDKVVQITSRMLTTIDSLLSFALLSNKEFELHKVNLNSVIKLSEEILSDDLEKSQCKIIVNEIPLLFGNESLLNTLFINLMSNSMKYQKKNTPLKLVITYQIKDDKCKIIYSDNGQGFKEEEIQVLMEPYSQLKLFPKMEGVGLGLASCKRILEQHKSNLLIKSEKGSGASYEFDLSLYS